LEVVALILISKRQIDGYIIVGADTNTWVIKIDTNGKELWKRTITFFLFCYFHCMFNGIYNIIDDCSCGGGDAWALKQMQSRMTVNEHNFWRNRKE